jgi:DNA-binding HxlR family transcriptional regulator
MIERQDQVSRETMHYLIIENNHLSLIPGEAELAPWTGKVVRMDSRVQYVFNLLGKRWVLQIITVLLQEPHSFNDLVQHVQGVSDRMLSERLKELECAGIVERLVRVESPIRVTYQLLEQGHALGSVIKAIWAWSQLP